MKSFWHEGLITAEKLWSGSFSLSYLIWTGEKYLILQVCVFERSNFHNHFLIIPKKKFKPNTIYWIHWFQEMYTSAHFFCENYFLVPHMVNVEHWLKETCNRLVLNMDTGEYRWRWQQVALKFSISDIGNNIFTSFFLKRRY